MKVLHQIGKNKKPSLADLISKFPKLPDNNYYRIQDNYFYTATNFTTTTTTNWPTFNVTEAICPVCRARIAGVPPRNQTRMLVYHGENNAHKVEYE